MAARAHGQRERIRTGVYEMTRILRLVQTSALLLLLFPCVAFAQANVFGSKFVLVTGPCTTSSGSGSPQGSMTGKVCDEYKDTATGVVYWKWTGTGNTGWGVGFNVNATINGTLTVGTINGQAISSSANLTGTLAVASTVTGGTYNGQMISSTANFTGTVGVTTSLTTPIVTAASNLTVSPTGDIITNPAGKDILPVTNYDIAIGSDTLRYKAISVGEMRVETLVAQDVLSTIGGRIIVAPTTLLTSDLGTGGTTITVKHNNLSSGDRIFLQDAPGGTPQIEYMAVTSVAGGSAGAYTYTVTRNLDGSGADAWYAGDAVLDTGQTGSGLIDIFSIQGILSTGVGPAIVGNVRTGSTYGSIEPRWLIGRMDGYYGYTSTSCSGSVPCFGAAFGTPTGAWIKIDPTNGLRLGYNTTTYTQIDAAGNATFTGDGSGVTSINGGNIQTGTVTASKISTSTLSAISADLGSVTAGQIVVGSSDKLWLNDSADGALAVGGSTKSTAPFRVTAAGALTATNVGVVYAPSGTPSFIGGSLGTSTWSIFRNGAQSFSIGIPTRGDIKFDASTTPDTITVESANVVMDNSLTMGVGIVSPLLGMGTSVGNTKLALYDNGAGDSLGFGIQANQFVAHLGTGSSNRFAWYDDPSLTNEVATISKGGNLRVSGTIQGEAYASAGPTYACFDASGVLYANGAGCP